MLTRRVHAALRQRTALVRVVFAMNAMLFVAAVLALLLMIYLFVALLRPEWF
jgi:K+-transporting ATPase KdpF subunit